MNHRMAYIGLSVMLMAVSLVSIQAETRAPRIVVDEPHFNFGQQHTEQTIDHTFVIRNKGSATLEITNIRSTCGCTVGEVSSRSIPPGGTSKITGRYNLRGRRGTQRSVLTVETNDPNNPRTQLIMSGTALQELEVQPNRIFFGQVNGGQKESRQIQLIGRPNQPFEIRGIENESEHITVTARETGSGHIFHLDVAFQAPQQPGTVPERLQSVIAAVEQYAVAFEPDNAYDRIMDALIQEADPQGKVLTDDVEQALARRRAGTVFEPGIRLGITNEYARIVRIEEAMPAGTSDIAVNDALLKINETDVTSSGLYRIKRLLRCDQAEPVSLTVRNADGGTATQRVERAESTLPDMEEPEVLPFDLVYLQVNRLRPGAGGALSDIIAQWADEQRYGIILDLRGADGDDLESVKAVAELFAQSGAPLFAYRDKNDQDLLVKNAGDIEPLTMPVMALIDAETGGAAEVLAAVLSDSVRGAMLFGQTTRGDMLVRDAVKLPDESRLYLATRRLITADGTTYIGTKGVRPDVIVAWADEDTTAYKPVRSSRTKVLDEEIEQEKLYHRARGDATLRRAIDVLLGLKALDIRPRATPSH